MPEQAVPAPVRPRPAAATVVADLELELARPVAHHDLGARRPGVLERVGEALLHDPVGREVDPGRQRPRLALHPDAHGEPGLAHLAGELVEAGQAGLGRQGGPLVGHLAQDAEHAAQLRQGAAPGLLHRCERAARALGVAVEHRLGRLGLHHHDAEAVGHDVVHLARDARPLLGRRRPRLGLARALGALGALGQLRGAAVALVEREADQPGDRRRSRRRRRRRHVALRGREPRRTRSPATTRAAPRQALACVRPRKPNCAVAIRTIM